MHGRTWYTLINETDNFLNYLHRNVHIILKCKVTVISIVMVEIFDRIPHYIVSDNTKKFKLQIHK